MIVLPAIVIAATAGAAWKLHKHSSKMTPERKVIYDNALANLKDPAELRKLADSFDKEGLKKEGDMLRKRAALREMPPDVKAARKDAYRKGMQSTDKSGVLRLAEAFHLQGATGAAASLRKYAAGLIHKKPAA